MRLDSFLVGGLLLGAITLPSVAQETIELVPGDYRAGEDLDGDGIFDVFRPDVPDLFGFSGDRRTAWEFDLYRIPVGARIISAELEITTFAFDAPRTFEINWYLGNGMVELDDFARDRSGALLADHLTNGAVSHSFPVGFDSRGSLFVDIRPANLFLDRWLGMNMRSEQAGQLMRMGLPDSDFPLKLRVTHSGGVDGSRFDFDDGTLQRFVHVLSDPLWEWASTTAEDSVERVSGDHRLLPSSFQLRDNPHGTLLLRSPAFVLREGDITLFLAGGRGAGESAAELPLRPSDLAASTSSSGVHAMGVGLYDPLTGNYLLTRQKGSANQKFDLIQFSAIDLAPFVGMDLHFDIFDSFSGPWGWIGVDSVILPGPQLLFRSNFEDGHADDWN